MPLPSGLKIGIMTYLLALLLTFLVSVPGDPPVVGKWKTIDDKTQKPLSVVEIYEHKGRFYGKVVEIFDPKDRKRTCEKCPGDDKDKPLIGLVVLKGLQKDGDEYNNGKILDPKHGRLYRCYITPQGPDKLKVRGFIGFSALGRTQYWHRVK